LSLRFGALYGRQDISTRRSVAYSGFDETLSADYAAETAQAFVELGYALKAGPVDLEPFGNLAYVHLHNGSFSESGGAAALDSAADNAGITYTTLGLHAATDASFGDIRATVRGTLGWRHAFGDRQTASTFSFTGGSDFTSYGDVITANSFIVEAGIDLAATPMSTIGLTYSGLYGSNSLSQTLKLAFSTKF
jgi:outer membrane autotransporter protein